MNEQDEDVYGQITGTTPPEYAPKRVPQWKLEEMATGRQPGPDSWGGSGYSTASAVTARPRHLRPWPVRTLAAVGTGLWALLKLILRLLFGAALLGLVAAIGLYLHGDLLIPGLGAPPAIQLPAPVAVPAAPRIPAVPVPVPAAAPPAVDTQVAAPRTVTDHPTPGVGENPSPLGAPAPLTATSAQHAFMQTRADGSAVSYDPCRAIHYVTRSANAPAAGPALIQEAVAAVSRATGLVFIDDGATTEAPAAQHESYQPARYGDRWAPVLIAWETAAEDPRFTNVTNGTNVLGLGGSEAVSIGGSGFSYVSGQLELNGPAIGRMIGQEGNAPARGVIEHELGHVVGLDHVQDPGQLMNPSETHGVSTYQAGDLTGLSELGQGKCQPGL
ncbi:MAG TPA: hypothetical protein VF867_15335 [Arthrobacter sp.]